MSERDNHVALVQAVGDLLALVDGPPGVDPAGELFALRAAYNAVLRTPEPETLAVGEFERVYVYLPRGMQVTFSKLDTVLKSTEIKDFPKYPLVLAL